MIPAIAGRRWPRRRSLPAAGVALALALSLLAGASPGDVHVVLDPVRAGLEFEGIGAVSAGGSTRLLVDYPEAARSRILDLLFLPHYGVSFQQLKVEIGGDVNSTAGTEPSHARIRGEADFTRGYEWWLMKEARKRNPRIVLDALAWGAPGWVGDGKFFSPDGAEYVAAFVRGARDVHGLDIAHVGILNEQPFDAEWVKLLRRRLDRSGLEAVRIVAADLNGPPERMWTIAEAAAKDPDLVRSLFALGVHYAHGETPVSALELRRSFGLRLWSTEDGEWLWDTMRPREGFRAATINRNFVERRLTRTSFWSPVTSYYGALTAPDSGVVTANAPWSGAFTVKPSLWAVAHTTQFAEPGWRYLEDACRLLPGGGSVVALVSPDGRDVSVVVETVGAKSPQSVVLEPAPGFALRRLHVWRTDGRASFTPDRDLEVADGRFALIAEPGAVYSLTTTTVQRKGDPPSPPPLPFPSPWREGFESYRVGATPRYLSDWAGAFEVAPRPDGGFCLRQQIHRRGIECLATPYTATVLGDERWANATVSVDAAFEAEPASGDRHVSVIARFAPGPTFTAFGEPNPRGYSLGLYSDGRWELTTAKAALASGRVETPGTSWHRLSLRCLGEQIEGSLDGRVLAGVRDGTYARGLSGIGSGFHPARFDDLVVEGTR